MRKLKLVVFAVFQLCFTQKIFGQDNSIVSLAGFFSNNMVLQRDKPIRFWGKAPAKSLFPVSFNNREKLVAADDNGSWMVSFDPMPAGGPYELKLGGTNPQSIQNIMLGDVWLVSGQSNMEFVFGNTDSVAADIKENTNIRYYSTSTYISNDPQTDSRRTDWQLCTRANIPGFSAVAYYFAQKLQKEIQVPIGIVNSSWGGTNIKAWISEDGIARIPEYKLLLDSLQQRRHTFNAIDSVNARNSRVSAANNNNIQAADNGYSQHFGQGNKGDAAWQPIELPGTWQTGQLADFDGVLWFRKEIELPAGVNDKQFFIHYGRNLGLNEMFINGVKVGSGNYFRGDNRLYLKPGAIVPGKNILVIRLFEKEKNAGFQAKAADMVIQSLDPLQPIQYPISGTWEFTPTLTLQQVENLQARLEPAPPNTTVSSIYNVKIHPLVPLAFKGVLWYQGESDAPVGYFYRTLLQQMIFDWRAHFIQPELPFIIAQLPAYGAVKNNPVEDCEWADLRESQLLALALPNTAMAVTLDAGNPLDIHPHNKKPVGNRMADAALVMTYHKKVYPLSPLMQAFSVTGNEIHIRFTNAGKGLMGRNNELLKGFAIAGADKVFIPARAIVSGADELVVSANNLAAPVAVRYAWANSPVEANLVNKDNVPAAPFRTDNWTLRTQDKVDNK